MDTVKIIVTVERCGHSSRVLRWAWAEAPPHVKTFITGDLGAVCVELSTLGYAFSVETEHVEISVLDWLGVQLGARPDPE